MTTAITHYAIELQYTIDYHWAGFWGVCCVHLHVALFHDTSNTDSADSQHGTPRTVPHPAATVSTTLPVPDYG